MQDEGIPFVSSVSPGRRTKRLRFFILLALAVFIVIGAFLGLSSYLSEKVVTLAPASGTKITFGNFTTTANEKVRVKPGTYKVSYSEEGYATLTKNISVQSATTLKTPQLDYSADRLKTLLQQNNATIHSDLAPALDTSGYTLSYEALYGRGQWYGAILTPADPTTQDIVRLIAENTNGGWKIVAGPSIVLSTVDYPNLPQSALSDIN